MTHKSVRCRNPESQRGHVRTRDAAPTVRTLIASFSENCVAEKEGDRLTIYWVGPGVDVGNTDPAGTGSDATPATLAQMNDRAAKFWRGAK